MSALECFAKPPRGRAGEEEPRHRRREDDARANRRGAELGAGMEAEEEALSRPIDDNAPLGALISPEVWR